MAKPIVEQMRATFFTLRLGVGVLGALFPAILPLGAWLRNKVVLQNSLSAYYHASGGLMRDYFVGLLFAVGVSLYLYKGFSLRENVALNIAGAAAFGVALFPMKWECVKHDSTASWFEKLVQGGSLHGAFAGVLFLCIAYVSVFRSEDTVKLLPQNLQPRFRHMYRFLAGLMITSPLSAFFINAFSQTQHTDECNKGSILFWLEACGIWAFALFWFVKTRELHLSEVEKKALRGKVAGDTETGPVALLA